MRVATHMTDHWKIAATVLVAAFFSSVSAANAQGVSFNPYNYGEVRAVMVVPNGPSMFAPQVPHVSEEPIVGQRFVSGPEPIMPNIIVPQGTYTIQKGAHLKSVARLTKTSLSDLEALNPTLCTDDLLPAGTVVMITRKGNW